MNRDGELCLLMWKGRSFFYTHKKGRVLENSILAGKLKNVLLRSKRAALHGNFVPENCVGLLTVPFVKARLKRTGKKR
jgi:hypothetical protein